MTILLIIAYVVSLLANFADQYTTYVALKSGGFRELNPIHFGSPTADAIVKCVVLPLVGLVLGFFLSALAGIIYNAIFGLGIALVAFRNYRLIRSRGI